MTTTVVGHLLRDTFRYSDAVDHAMAAYSLNRDLVAHNVKAGVDMAIVRKLLVYMAKVRVSVFVYQCSFLFQHRHRTTDECPHRVICIEVSFFLQTCTDRSVNSLRWIVPLPLLSMLSTLCLDARLYMLANDYVRKC